ncbi:3-phosphoshikimate 1-carboxyvinyltransferase [Defluviitalea saccharophila]|uniref:3-phosphoshikimate 1-carboxyvinyltransferase n=1 Tax=Defluviitalea saccharophila TaxID=879970 RepID=A0ABZ2Y9G4_9FIRM|nr:3-phosphoshikimate 1-carboxyvinyltransferase [Candidatus Epulonipiscium sp.]
MIVNPKDKINGEITVSGDKSISHRAVMLGSIAEGITEVTGFLMGADCLSTIECFRQLGIPIEVNEEKVIVHGKGLLGLSQPSNMLDVGNSGTTIRLMTGILSAQSFSSDITGDASIQKRPMLRVVAPLREMGAKIDGKEGGKYCPLHIEGQGLKGIHYQLPVASAQVKSAILLASLYAEGETTVIEPAPSRNHTEIMVNYFGGNILQKDNVIKSSPVKKLTGQYIKVPGDISSAAYFIVAALILPHSELLIKNVGVNPTRDGIITVFKQMGGNIELINQRTQCGEPVADILVRSSSLHGIEIGGSLIPKLIDEIPVIAAAACYARGTTIIKDAQELKVKESNRIQTMVSELKKMGASIRETDDGMIIEGGSALRGAQVESYHDHRVAMSLAIAALKAEKETTINNSDCVSISFPNFFSYLEKL